MAKDPSTAIVRYTYRYRITCSFIHENIEEKLNTSFIKYFVIESPYYDSKRHMPVIYLSMAVTNVMYNQIVSNENSGKILLTVDSHNVYSNTSLYKNIITGQFTYVVSTANPNYNEDITDQETVDHSYRGITLALYSLEALNAIKSSYNGIYNNISMSTLIVNAMEGFSSAVVKPLVYDPVFDNVIIPSLNSKSKLLNFLFEQCPFYDTEYMFFVDFNRTYLLDWSGDPVDAKDGQYNTVFLNVSDLSDGASFSDGLQVINNSYYIQINPAKINIEPNKGLDKISDQVIYIDDEGKVTYMDLDISKNEESTTKQTFERGANAILEKNKLQSSQIFIDLYKEHVDISMLTPNKLYMLTNYKTAEYNGKYAMVYKKEVFKNVNGEFTLAVNLGMRKIGEITPIGKEIEQAAILRNRSANRRVNTRSTSMINVNELQWDSRNGGATRTIQVDPSEGKLLRELNYTSPTSNVIPFVNRVKADNDGLIKLDMTSGDNS